MEEFKNQLKKIVATIIEEQIDPIVSRPEYSFGDFTSNVAMQVAGKTKQNPLEIAKKIQTELQKTGYECSVAGPGFINVKLPNQKLIELLQDSANVNKLLAGKKVVAEYSDPNPFKVLHAGHLYTSVVGDAVANVLQAAGAEVHRVNFGGDVGLHVGKTMWAIVQDLGGIKSQRLAEIPELKRSDWLASAYVTGNNTYEQDESVRPAIIEINKQIYQIVNQQDHNSELAKIYWTCRQWSYDYFDNFYNRIGTKFEKYYPESSVAKLGLDTVQKQLKNGVFSVSDGAVIFDAEPYGLHARVFINSQGLPTYEAKDIGLIIQKKLDYDFDISFVITGNEQAQYMQVVLKAVEQFAPELSNATKHITHGIVKLAGGVKMSSRKGNILKAVDIIDHATEANKTASGKDDQSVVLGAVKYSFLKQRLGGDIIYDPEESVSLEGNSGPYLQYAYARASSILRKSTAKIGSLEGYELNQNERELAVKLTEFKEVVDRVLAEYLPHHICTYLYELTQVFNRFYEKQRIIGAINESQKAALLSKYLEILSFGLSLLGIEAPERM